MLLTIRLACDKRWNDPTKANTLHRFWWRSLLCHLKYSDIVMVQCGGLLCLFGYLVKSICLWIAIHGFHLFRLTNCYLISSGWVREKLLADPRSQFHGFTHIWACEEEYTSMFLLSHQLGYKQSTAVLNPMFLLECLRVHNGNLHYFVQVSNEHKIKWDNSLKGSSCI